MFIQTSEALAVINSEIHRTVMRSVAYIGVVGIAVKKIRILADNAFNEAFVYKMYYVQFFLLFWNSVIDNNLHQYISLFYSNQLLCYLVSSSLLTYWKLKKKLSHSHVTYIDYYMALFLSHHILSWDLDVYQPESHWDEGLMYSKRANMEYDIENVNSWFLYHILVL